MQHSNTNAALTCNCHKVMRNAIVVHAVGQKLAHMATKKTRCQHVIAQLAKHAAHIEPLATSGLLRHHAVYVVNHQMINRITCID